MNTHELRILLINQGEGIDPLVRALNIVRRGKVKVKSINAAFNGEYINVKVIVEGPEDEVNWVCNKLSKLYDVAEVSSRAIPVEVGLQRVVTNG